MPRTRRSAPAARRGGARLVIQILGELLMTAGAVLLLFVAWQLWWTNVEADAKQGDVVKSFAQEVRGPLLPAPGASGASVDGPPETAPSEAAPGPGEVIGVAYIPRFGADYTRPIIQGTGPEVLDTLGLGHYATTAMPGEKGNVALAGHRQTHGAVLDAIHTLVPGDRLYLQTRDAYYTYVYRNTEIVLPDRTDILLPVPTEPGAVPGESLLTLTSCNPRFGSQERIIAYSTLESWRPASAGPPPAIAQQVAATTEGA